MFTEERLRSFSIQKNDNEFSQDELRSLAYDYLQKVVRGVNYKKWPYDVKRHLNSLGVYQEQGTGKPILDQCLADTMHSRLQVAEGEAQYHKEQHQKLIDLIRKCAPEIYNKINTYEQDGLIIDWEPRYES